MVLDDGQEVVAHCPNSGSMAACKEPGRPVYLSSHDNPKRKLKFTWELIEMPTSLVGVKYPGAPTDWLRWLRPMATCRSWPVYDHVATEVKVSAQLQTGSQAQWRRPVRLLYRSEELHPSSKMGWPAFQMRARCAGRSIWTSCCT